jgi:ABC-2 type transport system ATP-binding protein
LKTLIEAKNLLKTYHGREVVKGINLEIYNGEILALIGPNGAGKTTLISILLGIIKPDMGSVQYWRKDYKSHIGAQLQSTPFFEGYTTMENLMLFSALYNVRLDKEQLHHKLNDCGLGEAEKTPAVRLSLGQQKRLAIAVTTVHHPDLIILDEPTSGLDPRARHEIRKLIRELQQTGVTVLFSSHDMEEVSKMADRVILLENGQIVAQGSPENLLNEYEAENLEELYLTLTDTNLERN